MPPSNSGFYAYEDTAFLVYSLLTFSILFYLDELEGNFLE